MSSDDEERDPGAADLFSWVGRDVVERARLRQGVVAGTAFMPEEISAAVDGGDCIVCGRWPSRDAPHKRSLVGGRDVAVCRICAGLAKGVCDYLPDLRSCLQLLACNVEHACGGREARGGFVDDPEGGFPVSLDPILKALRIRFAGGFYVAACNCPAHVEAREVAAGTRRGFLREDDGGQAPPPFSWQRPLAKPDRPVDATQLPVSIIRTLSDKAADKPRYRGEFRHVAEIADEILARNRAETAYPGLKAGGLAERATMAATQRAAALWQRWQANMKAAANAGTLAQLVNRHRPVGELVILDDGDVALLNRILDRRSGDDRPYCDDCGQVGFDLAHVGIGRFCSECRTSPRIPRLRPLLDAWAEGAAVTFTDDRGRPCPRI